MHHFDLWNGILIGLFYVICRPPVISGSHTLQHPGRNKHEMMLAAQYQQQQQQQTQNMRQLGSHTMTMGRMPSHMSPQHHGANKHGESLHFQLDKRYILSTHWLYTFFS